MHGIQDPQVLDFIARSQAFYPADANLAGIEENRRIYDTMCAALRQQRPDGVDVEDRLFPAPDGDRGIAVRRYHRRHAPRHAPRQALVLYSHGGGYVLGGLDSHDDVCAEICSGTGCDVAAVDYRLAPEHLYPAQLDDVWAIYLALLAENTAIIVAGDSAGGCLSAALCLRAKRLRRPQPAGQVLIYPGLGGDVATLPSYTDNAQAPMLRTVDVEHYSTVLTGGSPPAQPADPELRPLAATDFSGLAPALVVSADVDPLRDDARTYAEQLRKAGVPVIWRNEEQLVHGYLRGRHLSRRIAASFTAICSWIAEKAGS